MVLLNSFLKIALKVAPISTRFGPEAGVPLVFAISPLLFPPYISNIYYPCCRREEKVRSSPSLQMTSASGPPQKTPNMLPNIADMYCGNSRKLWRIKLNPTNTQCVTFTQNPRKNKLIHLKLYGGTLRTSPTAALLRVTFQQKLKSTAHSTKVETEAGRRLNVICREKTEANPFTALKIQHPSLI